MISDQEVRFIALQRKNNPAKKATFFFVDVDNTLLMQDQFIEIPDKYRVKMKLFEKYYYLKQNKKNIAKVKQMFSKGFTCILWSAAGVKWAKQAARALKLQKYFKYILSKPYLYMDDKPPSHWVEINLYQK